MRRRASTPAGSRPVHGQRTAGHQCRGGRRRHAKEFERQKTGTLSALKTIRAYPLPPGGDLPVVFKPMRTPKKGH
jgi:hypothetical protein